MVKRLSRSDRPWLQKYLSEEWGSDMIVSRGKIHKASECDGFIAFKNNQPIGVITFLIENNEMEALSINVLDSETKKGVGTKLAHKLLEYAKSLKNLKRIWGITTNDNVEAIKFHQQSGLKLVAIYPNAMEESRKLKASIPLIGLHGIPIRDEIELEYRLID